MRYDQGVEKRELSQGRMALATPNIAIFLDQLAETVIRI
jgi:hypothetical protein